MENFRIKNVKTAVIFGAGHGIGLALTKELLTKNVGVQIFASYRVKENAQNLMKLAETFPNRLNIVFLEPINESSRSDFFQCVSQKTDQVDLIFNCIGVLNDENCQPEKNLSQITVEKLIHSFTVNAALTPLLAKTFLPLISRSSISLFSTLSAKVGSIEDNHLGGWYGYRGSKAALNMFIKNIAIECSNRSIPCILLSIHPGTTTTSLSIPYIKNSKLKIHNPKETAVNILSVINNKNLSDSGKFFNWNNTEIPW